MEEMQIDLDNDVLFKLMLMAHEQDITLNQLIENVLREELTKIEKNIKIKEQERAE